MEPFANLYLFANVSKTRTPHRKHFWLFLPGGTSILGDGMNFNFRRMDGCNCCGKETFVTRAEILCFENTTSGCLENEHCGNTLI